MKWRRPREDHVQEMKKAEKEREAVRLRKQIVESRLSALTAALKQRRHA